MSYILNSFVTVAPYINQLTTTDFAVSVCDLEKCLIYVPGKGIDHHLRAGDKHVTDSAAYNCILKKEKIIRKVDSGVFGFPYIVIAIPIFDSRGELIGTVTFSESVERQNLLLSLADNLYDTMKQLSSITELISENSTKLKDIGQELKGAIEKFQTKTGDTNKIVGSFRDIQKNINALGISLALESAKLIDKGTKFTKASEDMRNLASITEKETLSIEDTLKDLNNIVDQIEYSISQIIEISTNQIDINKYINSIVKDLNERTERLRENAHSLAR